MRKNGRIGVRLGGGGGGLTENPQHYSEQNSLMTSWCLACLGLSCAYGLCEFEQKSSLKQLNYDTFLQPFWIFFYFFYPLWLKRVCVCRRERERESVCVCVHACGCALIMQHSKSKKIPSNLKPLEFHRSNCPQLKIRCTCELDAAEAPGANIRPNTVSDLSVYQYPIKSTIWELSIFGTKSKSVPVCPCIACIQYRVCSLVNYFCAYKKKSLANWPGSSAVEGTAHSSSPAADAKCYQAQKKRCKICQITTKRKTSMHKSREWTKAIWKRNRTNHLIMPEVVRDDKHYLRKSAQHNAQILSIFVHRNICALQISKVLFFSDNFKQNFLWHSQSNFIILTLNVKIK